MFSYPTKEVFPNSAVLEVISASVFIKILVQMDKILQMIILRLYNYPNFYHSFTNIAIVDISCWKQLFLWNGDSVSLWY